MEANQPLVATSVRDHDVLKHVEQIFREPAQSYLGVPIRNADGTPVGTLCVYDVKPHQWDEDDVALLVELARSSMSQIDLTLEALARKRAENALGSSEALLSAIAANLPGLVFERRKIDDATAHYTFFGETRKGFSGSCALVDGPDGPLQHIHDDDRERVREAVRRNSISETDLDLTFRVLDPEGRVRWLRSQSAVRRDKDENVLWDGVCFDISDLVAARDAAEAARHLKDTLLTDVSHELRTPLQAIIGFTEFLKTETRPEIVRAHALTIQNAGEALLTIVNQLLDLAQIEGNGLTKIERVPINIKTLAETCHDMMAPLALEKGIGSNIEVDADAQTTVLADGPKLQQVLVNLLNNAIKFTETGSVSLHVMRSGDTLRFSVSDTGIGIPDDKIDLLFHRFSRIAPGHRDVRGTGLGLAIAKQLVESMNGRIGVMSNPDRGTTFWFEVQAVAVAPPATTAVARPEPEQTSVGARILIADDLDLNRKLIADMLSLDGHDTDCVCDGAAALEAASTTRYDLILMDMIMPVMDGIAATRAIRALPSPACDVPIIALTAHSFKEQLDSCIAAGMNATLTKPMSLDLLNATVRSWTQGRSKAA